MKLFIYIIIALAAGLLIFNAIQIDYAAPLTGDSAVAVICVLAAACVILLLWILRTSLLIQRKTKR